MIQMKHSKKAYHTYKEEKSIIPWIWQLVEGKTRKEAEKALHDALKDSNTNEDEKKYINNLLEKWRYGI